MSEIMSYIRNSKNQKVGIIKAVKYEDQIIIVHAKCNIKHDEFDIERGEDICGDRLMFVVGENLNNRSQLRQKSASQKPTRALKKEYEKMLDRAFNYFKDVPQDRFYCYIEFFEYLDYVKGACKAENPEKVPEAFLKDLENILKKHRMDNVFRTSIANLKEYLHHCLITGRNYNNEYNREYHV